MPSRLWGYRLHFGAASRQDSGHGDWPGMRSLQLIYLAPNKESLIRGPQNGRLVLQGPGNGMPPKPELQLDSKATSPGPTAKVSAIFCNGHPRRFRG